MTDSIKQKLAEGAEGTETSPENLLAENKFQKYTSAREAMRMVTTTGFRITFTKHTYLTQNPEAIAYLDEEIAKGLREVVKGDVLTTEDLDPMAALRKQHYAEFKAMQEAEQLAALQGKSKDMGTTVGAPLLKTLTSKDVPA